MDTGPTSAHFHLDAVPTVDADAHLIGHFDIVWGAAEFGGQVAGGAFHLLLAAAQISRSPIRLPQAIQDRAFDAVLGIAVEGNVLGAVILCNGIEQAHDAGVNEVVEIDVDREAFVNTNGNRLHQRQVIEHDLIALLLRKLRSVRYRHTGSAHGFLPLSGFSFFGSPVWPTPTKVAALVPLSF